MNRKILSVAKGAELVVHTSYATAALHPDAEANPAVSVRVSWAMRSKHLGQLCLSEIFCVPARPRAVATRVVRCPGELQAPIEANHVTKVDVSTGLFRHSTYFY